jgi:hypothetical protein
MTAFLWTVVILMAASLLAEILAFIGMALVAKRTARRASELRRQISETDKASVNMVQETKLSIQPRLQAIHQDGRQMGLFVASRLGTLQAAYSDASRRAERIRLRLNDSVQTVEEHRRGVYREVAEPIQAASQVLRGLRLAFWFWRKVA